MHARKCAIDTYLQKIIMLEFICDSTFGAFRCIILCSSYSAHVQGFDISWKPKGSVQRASESPSLQIAMYFAQITQPFVIAIASYIVS